MQKIIINPWEWQNRMGFAQAIEVSAFTHTLYCSGQAGMDADGNPSQGQMQEQLQLSMRNLETVLHQAGYAVGNIVRINYLTIDAQNFLQFYGSVIDWLEKHKCKATSTLFEVQALAFPSLLVEIEVTAVK